VWYQLLPGDALAINWRLVAAGCCLVGGKDKTLLWCFRVCIPECTAWTSAAAACSHVHARLMLMGTIYNYCSILLCTQAHSYGSSNNESLGPLQMYSQHMGELWSSLIPGLRCTGRHFFLFTYADCIYLIGFVKHVLSCHICTAVRVSYSLGSD
jgi:hypothetical protein